LQANIKQFRESKPLRDVGASR